MAKAKSSTKPIPAPGVGLSESQHLHDLTHKSATRHGVSVPQMHQRLDDMSRYIRSIREEMMDYVKWTIGDVWTSKIAAIEDCVFNLDERLHRIETLLLKADFDTFEAIDKTIVTCRQSFAETGLAEVATEYQEDSLTSVLETVPEGDIGARDDKTVEEALTSVGDMDQAKLSKSARLSSDLDGARPNKQCGHEELCLCGFWASTDGCVVKVHSLKCDFICQGEYVADDRSEVGSEDDEAAPDIEAKEDGTFKLWSWMSASVTIDRVDWAAPDREIISWHRLSFLTDGRFVENVSSLSVGDAVMIKEALYSVDSKLGVQIPVGVGGCVEAVDEHGQPSIHFPSIEGLAADCCCVSKDLCRVLRR